MERNEYLKACAQYWHDKAYDKFNMHRVKCQYGEVYPEAYQITYDSKKNMEETAVVVCVRCNCRYNLPLSEIERCGGDES